MENKPIKTWIALTPHNVQLATLPDGGVAIRCFLPEGDFGLAEGVGIALRMTPAEARRIGRLLSEQADMAEASQSPRQ